MAERNEPGEAGNSLERKDAAYQALKSGNLEKARELFESLSQSYPWVASFKFNLALICFKLGQFQKAMENVDAGLAIEPDDEKAKSMKRAIESRSKKAIQGTMPEEDRIKPATLERNSEDEKMTNYILGGQFVQHRIVLPGNEADTAVPPANQPEYSSSRLMNFVVFEKQRHRTELRSTYENLIDDEPHATRLSWYFSDPGMNEDNKALPNITIVHARPTVTEESVDDLMSKIDLLPKGDDMIFIDTTKARYSYEIRYIKETINELHRSHQYQHAVKACAKFLNHFPDDLEVLFELGNLHLEKGNIIQSETTFKKILEMYYDNAYAWQSLARVYEIRGLWQFQAFCLQQAKTFGYPVDEIQLARLLIKGIPIDPFTDNVQWE